MVKKFSLSTGSPVAKLTLDLLLGKNSNSLNNLQSSSNKEIGLMNNYNGEFIKRKI